jgi:murein DD-endopeptidase MepM/ murein hydrolase activator NlpD
MRYQNPKGLVLLIARQGKAPLKIPVHPLPVCLGLLAMVGIPAVWAGNTVYNLHQQNYALSQSAAQVLVQLEVLDQEVEELQKRAKLPKKRWSSFTLPQRGGQGGVSIKISPEEQFQFAQKRLPTITTRLKHQVKPELEGLLRKEAALEAAVPKGKPTRGLTSISSEFGIRSDPFGGGGEFHNGIDLIGPYGSPIYATATGKVETAEDSGGYGNHVILKHGYGYETLYAHLSEMSVRRGATVKRGQLLGFMGSTGRSTGTHLHYSIFLKSKPIDPQHSMTIGTTVAQR